MLTPSGILATESSIQQFLGKAHQLSSRLDQIRDWPLLAKKARYNAQALATISGVTPRQLRRYFTIRKQSCPHKWLHTLRIHQAVELICDGTPIKETAFELGYKDAAHFTHDFTGHFGFSPSKFLESRRRLEFAGKNVRF